MASGPLSFDEFIRKYIELFDKVIAAGGDPHSIANAARPVLRNICRRPQEPAFDFDLERSSKGCWRAPSDK